MCERFEMLFQDSHDPMVAKLSARSRLYSLTHDVISRDRLRGSQSRAAALQR